MKDIEIKIQGQVKYSDWLRVVLRNFLISLVGILLISIAFSWYFAIYDPSQCPICVGFLIFSSSLAIWTVILSLLTVFTLHVFKRQHVFESLNGLITSEEIQITQASLNQTINWKRYVKFKKFSKVLLLYDSPYSFHIFPKHIFEGEEDWRKFVDLVKIQINAKKKDTL
ncbi:YcxB family protein [Candidatus Leptofilum sp.]|uniref:YcxB family protein n=1 Tax=Candidatus Leptofilum sp. TaxID=3241576 RepID=UPI003B5C7829